MWQPLLKKLKNCFTTVSKPVSEFELLFSFSLGCSPSPWLVFPLFSSAPFVYLVITSLCPVSHSFTPGAPTSTLLWGFPVWQAFQYCYVFFPLVWYILFFFCPSVTFGQFVDFTFCLLPSWIVCLAACAPLNCYRWLWFLIFFKHILCCCTSLRITLGLEIHKRTGHPPELG